MVARILHKLAKALVDLSSFWLFGIMFLVGADVFFRYTFNMPISGTLEISEQSVVIITFLCFAYTGMQNRHIRTNAILRRLPPSFRSFADILATCLMLLILSFLIWQTSIEAWNSLSIHETRMGLIEVPIYPTKIAVSIGLSVAWVYYFLTLITQFKKKNKINLFSFQIFKSK